jgi:hypothetical protein
VGREMTWIEGAKAYMEIAMLKLSVLSEILNLSLLSYFL